jgi:hypothetical protein
MSHEVFFVTHLTEPLSDMRLQKYLNSIDVTRKTLRRIYCQFSRIFPEISCFYDPLQAVINNFELNCIFSSTLILFASIYCKKAFQLSHFPNFWSVSTQNAKSSGPKPKFQDPRLCSFQFLRSTLLCRS